MFLVMFNFASAETAPLAAEKLFNIGPLPLTNTMLFGFITAIFVLAVFTFAARSSQLWPKSKFAFIVESLIEAIINQAADTFGSRKKALKHLPLLLSLFSFILASNLSGLLPGVGSLTVSS